MRTLIINGSPKAKHGNTKVFIDHFIMGKEPSFMVCYAAIEDPVQIAEYIKQYSHIIIAMPLYIHAMPGIVMKIIECMAPAEVGEEKSIGFIVQSGFIESEQSKYLENYLMALAKRLNFNYLGTAIRGGSAGVSMMPEKMNRKLFKQLQILGDFYSKHGTFNDECIRKFSKTNRLTKGMSLALQVSTKLGVGDSIFWNSMLRKNKAINKRFDKPFV